MASTNPENWLTFLRTSRGNCGHGLLHHADAHGWRYVLLLCDRPRPEKDSAFQRGRNPNALRIVQQLREAWPYVPAHRFLLFERDAKFGPDVIAAATGLGSQPIRTAFRSLWQNGVAERWVGSCRRDLLDDVIVLNEQHLKRPRAKISPCPVHGVATSRSPEITRVGLLICPRRSA